jgi:hypothetical protein
MSKGINRIIIERQRQIEIEYFDAEHDRDHPLGDLADAAACYARAAAAQARGHKRSEIKPAFLGIVAGREWPWDDQWLKLAEDPIRNLEKAGALIAAEIDRLLDSD